MSAAPGTGFGSADLQMLTELAFIAAGRGAVPAADALAGGLACLRPGQATPGLVLALAHLNAGDHAAGAALLAHCPAQDEAERSLLQGLLGLALQGAGRAAESRRVLQAAAGQPGGRLARAMLGHSPGSERAA